MIVGDLIFTEVERDELISQILADVRILGPQMGSIKKELERWTEFVNPYWRLTRSISSLRKELALTCLIFSDQINL